MLPQNFIPYFLVRILCKLPEAKPPTTSGSKPLCSSCAAVTNASVFRIASWIRSFVMRIFQFSSNKYMRLNVIWADLKIVSVKSLTGSATSFSNMFHTIIEIVLLWKVLVIFCIIPLNCFWIIIAQSIYQIDCEIRDELYFLHSRNVVSAKNIGRSPKWQSRYCLSKTELFELAAK